MLNDPLLAESEDEQKADYGYGTMQAFQAHGSSSLYLFTDPKLDTNNNKKFNCNNCNFYDFPKELINLIGNFLYGDDVNKKCLPNIDNIESENNDEILSNLANYAQALQEFGYTLHFTELEKNITDELRELLWADDKQHLQFTKQITDPIDARLNNTRNRHYREYLNADGTEFKEGIIDRVYHDQKILFIPVRFIDGSCSARHGCAATGREVFEMIHDGCFEQPILCAIYSGCYAIPAIMIEVLCTPWLACWLPVPLGCASVHCGYHSYVPPKVVARRVSPEDAAQIEKLAKDYIKLRWLHQYYPSLFEQ